ncbi:MAG: hypothetical protein ACRD4Y_08265, partial [Candidatus Acidiferrales bacterium]
MILGEANFGAQVDADVTRFCVWAPEVKSAEVVIESPGRNREAHIMTRGADGFHRAAAPGISDGDLYR